MDSDANMAAFLFMQEVEEVEADVIDDELYNTQLSAALLTGVAVVQSEFIFWKIRAGRL